MKAQMQKGFTLIELMIVVAIIGILAAIAIPQYQDYTARSQLSEAMTLVGGLKTPIAEAYSQNGAATSCAIPTGAVTSGKYVAGTTATGAADLCTLQATMKATGVATKVVSATVNMAYVPTTGAWTCTSSAPAEVVPASCKP